MKIIGNIQIEAVTDVVCDICLRSTRVTGGGLQYATLQAHWGYGAKHDGEGYELHLCESRRKSLTHSNTQQSMTLRGISEAAYGSAKSVTWVKIASAPTYLLTTLSGFSDLR